MKKITKHKTSNKNAYLTFPLVLIGLILIFSYGMGNAAAASNATIYVSTGGNDSWNGQYATHISGTSGPKLSIKNATGTVASDGTIKIANGQYTGITNTEININKNMTIQGQSEQGTIINGTNTNWIFTINNGIKVTINNLTLTNGTTTNGGAINNRGILNMTNCKFTSNYAADYGGAIINEGTLNVDNCTFTNNNAIYDGGAIKNNGILIVKNSNFTYNHVTSVICILDSLGGEPAGGAIRNDNSMTLSNSNFEQNTAQYGYGGAIYNNGCDFNMADCNFKMNRAQYGYGGAIYNVGGTSSKSVRISGSSFNNNTSGNYIGGGAIYNFDGYLDITQCSFTNNIAHYGLGGAIYNQACLTILNSTFTNNIADGGYGGAIDNRDYLRLKVTGSTFTNNYAMSGGAIYSNENRTTIPEIISSNTFSNNTANNYYGYGGAIYTDGNANINFNRIIGNTANQGSSLYNDDGKVDASLNWWGSNTDPSGEIRGSGIIYNPWIILTITSNPNTISYGSKSTITTDLLYDSNNKYHNPVNGHIPDGIIVNFTSDELGNINLKSTTTTNSATNTTFTGLNLGISLVSSNVDNQTITTSIKIKTPTEIIVKQITGNKGETVNLTATLINVLNKKNISGKTIQFIINGTNIGSAVTNSNGIATLSYTITQNAGYYYITTIFAGDNIYSYSNGGATLKVPHSNIYIAAINSTKPIANSECIPMEPTGVPIIPLFVGALMMVAGITNNKRKN